MSMYIYVCKFLPLKSDWCMGKKWGVLMERNGHGEGTGIETIYTWNSIVNNFVILRWLRKNCLNYAAN